MIDSAQPLPPRCNRKEASMASLVLPKSITPEPLAVQSVGGVFRVVQALHNALVRSRRAAAMRELRRHGYDVSSDGVLRSVRADEKCASSALPF